MISHTQCHASLACCMSKLNCATSARNFCGSEPALSTLIISNSPFILPLDVERGQAEVYSYTSPGFNTGVSPTTPGPLQTSCISQACSQASLRFCLRANPTSKPAALMGQYWPTQKAHEVVQHCTPSQMLQCQGYIPMKARWVRLLKQTCLVAAVSIGLK